jgi:flavin reductase (DIM6/NTAB) family NADH-FMN oxidoreductase RutF
MAKNYKKNNYLDNKKKTTKKVNFKPANLLYPLPAVMVSCGISSNDHNIITIAWVGTICSDPVMVSISVRPSRYSYNIIKKDKEFVINLTNTSLLRATDFCGVVSGRDVDKWDVLKLKKDKSSVISSPQILEAPISIECRVKEVISLGTHDCFISEVVSVAVKEELITKSGYFDLEKAKLLVYNHGFYYELGKKLASFGYSIKK